MSVADAGPNHWLETASKILRSDIANLRELARLAGSDPRFFYRGVNLRRADLRGQDLRGMDFTGANLRDAKIDPSTLLDKPWDLKSYEADFRQGFFPNQILDELDRLNNDKFEGAFYRRRLFQYLVVDAVRRLKSDDEELPRWIRALRDDQNAMSYFRMDRSDRRFQQFKLSIEVHRFVLSLGKSFSGESAGYLAIVMIALKMRDISVPPANSKALGKTYRIVNLAEIRAKYSVSREELAELSGVSVNTIAEIERERWYNRVSEDTVLKLERGLTNSRPASAKRVFLKKGQYRVTSRALQREKL